MSYTQIKGSFKRTNNNFLTKKYRKLMEGYMRKSRLRRFKKRNQPFIQTTKFIFIFYFTLTTLSHVTSNTNAIFISGVENTNIFSAAWVPSPPMEEWDNSSLKFWNEELANKSPDKTGGNKKGNSKKESLKDHYGLTCEKGLFADIFNDGEIMEGTSLYFIRYSASGDINKHNSGEIVYEGVIPVIESQDLERLQFKPNFNDGSFKPGIYKMSALQRPSHPGETQNESKEYEGRFEIWAETSVTVTEQMINTCSSSNAIIDTKTESSKEPESDESKNSVENPEVKNPLEPNMDNPQQEEKENKEDKKEIENPPTYKEVDDKDESTEKPINAEPITEQDPKKIENPDEKPIS
jgi:hypothetical protein